MSRATLDVEGPSSEEASSICEAGLTKSPVVGDDDADGLGVSIEVGEAASEEASIGDRGGEDEDEDDVELEADSGALGGDTEVKEVVSLIKRCSSSRCC
mmetsp:Transcript_33409/g.71600  ORF Transcript_33409/g.71600 Transcript_33409/m.71600 type:complete len:99 (+) Transcript_33409:96-392(+)